MLSFNLEWLAHFEHAVESLSLSQVHLWTIHVPSYSETRPAHL